MKRKRAIKILFLSALSISLLAVFAACGGGSDPSVSPDSSSDGMEEQVTDYMLDEERKYTGTVQQRLLRIRH